MVSVGVIGSGLAGLSVATNASIGGAEVTVYEKNLQVDEFACGEIFSALPAYKLTKPLAGARYAAQKFIFHVIRDHEVILPEDVFWVTDRDVFQRGLAELAEKCGAEFDLGKRAEPKDVRRKHDWVIDASGHPSASWREYGVARIKEAAGAVFYRMKGDFSSFGRDLHFYWTHEGHHGYYWIFPKSDSEANVGAGWSGGRPPTFRDLDNFLTFITPRYVTMRGASILPMAPASCFQYENVLLAGDAAGLMNCTLGGGAHLAVVSGALAGALVSQGRQQEYSKLLWDTVGREISNSRFLYSIGRRLSLKKFDTFMEAMALRGVDIFFSHRNPTMLAMSLAKDVIKCSLRSTGKSLRER